MGEIKATKREIYGEILKDQYLTNAELLFNELIGGTEYLVNDINKMQEERTKDCTEQDYYEKLASDDKYYKMMKSRNRNPVSTSVHIDCDKHTITETKKDLSTGESKDTITQFRNCLIKECKHNVSGLCSRKDIIEGKTQCNFDNGYAQFMSRKE